jgi:hypothetical protein
LINELDINHYFKKSNLASTKLLLEKEGIAIEHKYGGTELVYVGVPVLITSNTLPTK